MAENRAAFILRRRRSLGFSKWRWLRTSFKVPSRSIFFFNRRKARSTDSPFLSLISVKLLHFLSSHAGRPATLAGFSLSSGREDYVSPNPVSTDKDTAKNRSKQAGVQGQILWQKRPRTTGAQKSKCMSESEIR